MLRSNWKLYLCAGLLLAGCSGERPENLGVVNGRLAQCPPSPNCVSSFAENSEHQISPLRFTSTPEKLMRHIKTILHKTEGARIITADGHYIHAEFTSKIFGFVDDVELLLDPPTQTLHFRSASRVGHSDLGVNRKRLEKLKTAFAQFE